MDDGAGAIALIDRQRLGSLLGLVVGVAGIAFVVVRVARDWGDFTDAVASAAPGWIVAASIAGIAAVVGIGVNWIALLRGRGVVVGTRRGFSWFAIGQLGKYVPGGIWPIVGQAELARRGGARRGDAYTATATSMLATLLGAVSVAAIGGLVSPFHRRSIAAALLLVLVVGFGCLSSPRLTRRIHALGDRVTKKQIRLPAAAPLAVQTVRHLPVWLFFSATNVCVLAALRVDLDSGIVVDVAFATCVAWMAGFVIIGLPGGIGVREAVFVSLMTVPIGAAAAVSVAVIGRLVSIVADLAAAGGGAGLATIRGPWHGPSH